MDGVRPEILRNEEIIAEADLEPGYIANIAEQKLKEIERRRRLYRGDQPPLDVSGRTVIVVDDGIASGASVKAALRAASRKGPRRLVLAVPVAPGDTVGEFGGECDEFVCLYAPETFFSVGAYYEDFRPVSDGEVIELLRRAPGLRFVEAAE